MSTLLERIQFLFEKNNEVPAQVFPKLGLTKGYLSDLKRKNGSPSSEVILKLSEYFSVSTDYLLKGTFTPKDTISKEEQIWMDLYKELELIDDKSIKSECIGFVKGYIKAYIDQNQKPPN